MSRLVGHWLSEVPLLPLGHFSNAALTAGDAAFVLARRALAKGESLYEFDASDQQKLIVSPIEFRAALVASGLNELSQSWNHCHDCQILTYESETAFLCCTLRPKRPEIQSIRFLSIDKDEYAVVKEVLEHSIRRYDADTVGQIYLLRYQGGEFNIGHLGKVGIPLIRENYSETVLAKYDHVVADLSSKEPCGRLIIMSGEPGCGKTWMLRGLFCDVPEAKFVWISPDSISRINSPEMLPDLKDALTQFNGPVVLIAEDADSCLLPRMGDNMSLLQSMLNATDGIIGQLLDIRIICTTNAAEYTMDKAVVRPGRLCRHIPVPKLIPSHAQRVFERLNIEKKLVLSAMPPFSKEGSGGATLAEIYAHVNALRSAKV
jgi:hypothetical protein